MTIISCVMLLTVISNIDIMLAVMISLVGSIAIILCLYGSSYRPKMKKFMKNHKIAIQEKFEKKEYLIEFKGLNSEEYPLKKLLQLQIKEFFNNSGMATFLYMVITLVLCMFLILYPLAAESMEDKNSFKIMYDNEKTYVIIHASEDFYYVEEVLEGEDILTVYKTKQRILKRDDIIYEVKEFKTIKFVE